MTKLQKGIWLTSYGNTAIYKGGKTAYDLDMAERIPIELLDKWIKPLEK